MIQTCTCCKTDFLTEADSYYMKSTRHGHNPYCKLCTFTKLQDEFCENNHIVYDQIYKAQFVLAHGAIVRFCGDHWECDMVDNSHCITGPSAPVVVCEMYDFMIRRLL